MDDNGYKLKIAELDKVVAVLQTELKCSVDARDLQAREYERRLTELNHAHERQMERNRDYVSNSVFSMKITEIEKWMRANDKWTWFSIGAGAVGGGVVAGVLRWIAGVAR